MPSCSLLKIEQNTCLHLLISSSIEQVRDALAIFVVVEEEHGLRAISVFKTFSKLVILSIVCICMLSHACGSAGKGFVLWPQGHEFKSPWDHFLNFFITIFLIFFTNFNNFVHLSKLIIYSWFFAHLSFNMSILWSCQKIPEIFTFWLFFI